MRMRVEVSRNGVRCLLVSLLAIGGCPKPKPKPDLSSPAPWGPCETDCPTVHPIPPGSVTLGTPNATDPLEGVPRAW